ncbi:MAG: hypothetical protein CSB13_11400 [Chloroflexi bacterium]|nr:MAG: hypothetical protein CSB13_11400 [Chloroflexota bacterium]
MSIGTLGEKSLHAGLKEWVSQPGDEFEVKVDGFIIDIVRDQTLIEIQTRHLYAMKRKLTKLLANGYEIQLLHPIAQEKWIVRETAVGEAISRRKSPKRGKTIDIFKELLYITDLILHPHLTIQVLLTQEEEILRDDGKGSWRRKRWSVYDRRLLNVGKEARFTQAEDYLAVIPDGLERPFTNKQLAHALNCRPALATKITYTLRQMGLLEILGKQGRSYSYQIKVTV